MSYDSMIDEVMRKQAKVCADLRAEVERLRALDKEAKSAFAPWVQGPGVVGGILHLQEEVERLRAEANARAVEELTRSPRRSRTGRRHSRGVAVAKAKKEQGK